MAKKLQLRGGTTSDHGSFTGAVREVTVDTDLKTLRVHDGSTAGGIQLARLTDVSGATSVGTLTSLTVSGDVTVDTSTLKVDSTNNRVGIGQATPSKQFEINNSGDTELLIKSGNSSVGKILFFSNIIVLLITPKICVIISPCLFLKSSPEFLLLTLSHKFLIWLPTLFT